jgi:hypothetical protein
MFPLRVCARVEEGQARGHAGAAGQGLGHVLEPRPAGAEGRAAAEVGCGAGGEKRPPAALAACQAPAPTCEQPGRGLCRRQVQGHLPAAVLEEVPAAGGRALGRWGGGAGSRDPASGPLALRFRAGWQGRQHKGAGRAAGLGTAQLGPPQPGGPACCGPRLSLLGPCMPPPRLAQRPTPRRAAGGPQPPGGGGPAHASRHATTTRPPSCAQPRAPLRPPTCRPPAC